MPANFSVWQFLLLNSVNWRFAPPTVGGPSLTSLLLQRRPSVNFSKRGKWRVVEQGWQKGISLGFNERLTWKKRKQQKTVRTTRAEKEFFSPFDKRKRSPPKSLSPKVVAGKRNRDQTSKRKGAKQIDCLWKEKSPRLNFLEGRRRRHRTLWYYYFFPYQLFSFFPNAEGKGEEGGRKVLLANFLYFFFRLTNGEPKNFVFLRKKSFKKKKIAPKRSSSAMIFYSAGAWI